MTSKRLTKKNTVTTTGTSPDRYELTDILLLGVNHKQWLTDYFTPKVEITQALRKIFFYDDATTTAHYYSVSGDSRYNATVKVDSGFFAIGCQWFSKEETLKLADWALAGKWYRNQVVEGINKKLK